MRIESDIIPLGEIEEKIIEALVTELKDSNFVVRVYAKTNPPKTALNVYRRQYNADIIFDTLRKLKGNIVAITNLDLYTGKLNFIFSVAEVDGPVLVSTYRLRPEFYQEKPNFDLLIERMSKEILYSVFKTQGLNDCTNTKCLMHKTTSVGDLDYKQREFCKDCKINNTVKGFKV